MRETDIVIAGGGLAGSTAAAMLGRSGFDVVMVDPHSTYPPELRCEKLDASQVALLRRTGLAEPVLAAATPDAECWTARMGRVVDKRPGSQWGILYDTLVNTVRAQIPGHVAVIRGQVAGVGNSPSCQRVTLSNGEVVSTRLVVLATGLNSGLRRALRIEREDVSKCHSITIAFDLEPLGRPSFDFAALTYYGEHPAHRVAYLTLFPVRTAMRANLMVYREAHDPWLQEMRQRPMPAMNAVMPRLSRLIGPAQVAGPVAIRPADIYRTHGHGQPGIVLVGDAFATSCPAAGTGCGKVLTDVERLCNVHVPTWMATPGMSAEKIAAFYADPVKLACDRHSLEWAFELRALSVEKGVSWQLKRWNRFLGRLAISAMARTS